MRARSGSAVRLWLRRCAGPPPALAIRWPNTSVDTPAAARRRTARRVTTIPVSPWIVPRRYQGEAGVGVNATPARRSPTSVCGDTRGTVHREGHGRDLGE